MVMTSIALKQETWKRLLNRKAYPSQTFDVIINNLMDFEIASMPYKYNNLNLKEVEDGNNKMANLENTKQDSGSDKNIQNNIKTTKELNGEQSPDALNSKWGRAYK